MAISQGLKNILHTCFVTVSSAVIGAIIPAVTSGHVSAGDGKSALLAGAAAGLAYIVKLLTAGSSKVNS